MDLKFKTNQLKRIKLVLIFFLFIITLGCVKEAQVEDFVIHFEDGKAHYISFASSIEQYQVFLKNNETIAILGNYDHDNFKHIFRPLIPLSPGEEYEIRSAGQRLYNFTIKDKRIHDHVAINNIFPSIDTVPQNLLKFYIEFSQPMQAIGKSSDYITIIDKTDRTEQSIFLELENELWNSDRTLLTLWLDPGRIKKDLIPNRAEGMPLVLGHNYEITISENWKSATGDKLNMNYSKSFKVAQIDDKSPKIDEWEIIAPNTGTTQELRIDLNDTLDAQLLLETVKILNDKKMTVKGEVRLKNNESVLFFGPENSWKAGKYYLSVESRLEDLAGNNLNRLFDSDLKQITTIKTDSNSYHTRAFRIY